jgi:hypothetical protein
MGITDRILLHQVIEQRQVIIQQIIHPHCSKNQVKSNNKNALGLGAFFLYEKASQKNLYF